MLKVLIKIELKNQIFNQCYKTSLFSCFICKFDRSPYICTVFFIVLDLRLTKDWLSGIDSLFLCFKTGEFLHKKFNIPTIASSNSTQPNTTKVNKKKQYVYLSIEAIYELPSLN